MDFGSLIFKHRRMTFLSLFLLVYEGNWRSSSGSNPLKNDNFPPRNKENQSQPTQSSLDKHVAPTKALTTKGKGRVK